MTNMVSFECLRLHEFVDGELRDGEAESFMQHLASCERCAADMPRMLELLVVCDGVATGQGVALLELPANSAVGDNVLSRRRLIRYAAAIACAATAAAVLVVMLSGPRSDDRTASSLVAGLPPTREIEVRLSYEELAAHRKYAVQRGGGQREAVSRELLAALERAGNWHGLAAASLLRGDRTGAHDAFARAERSSSVDVDRAALEIIEDSDDARRQALTRLDAVLLREPRNTAARWNRALVLAQLGLQVTAAQEFDKVAAAGEPGWSTEASERAAMLRAGFEPRRRAWEATDEAGKRWIAGDGPFEAPPNAPHGWLRYLFYDAVRAADSRAQVEQLLPLAQQLDTSRGSDVLQRYVRKVAAADFRTRAPLARAYREVALARVSLDDAAVDALAARMRAAGATDLWMGLLGRTRSIGRHLSRYRKAAEATGDPWFAVLAEHEHAKHAIASGDRLEGERLLFLAADHAAREGLDYRRSRIEEDISGLYLELRRYPDAERVARKALEEARAIGEWARERFIIHQLAEATRYRHEPALSRAYLGEVLARDPETCETRMSVRQSLANLAMMELDPATARRELESAPLCDKPITALAAITWADLYRFVPAAVDVARLREGLSTLRATGSAWADHIEGRLVIEMDRPAGQALLRTAIAGAAERSDDTSTKMRGNSFSLLVLDAGRAGEYDKVFDLLAEELGGPAPDHCAVGIAAEDERAIVVVRDATGAVAGRYDNRRLPHGDIAPLIRDIVLPRVTGCREVSVLARPPLGGTPRLLPDHLAWSYRLRLAAGRPAGRATGPRVVVADTDPPRYLELPRLLPYSGGGLDTRILRGPEATPDRVRAAMRDASVIEFHTHGFIDRGLSDASYLALTADRDGRYALTAADVQVGELRRAPLVILAACHAAAGAAFVEASPSLPDAFMRAGARAVLASPAPVGDADAGKFFNGVLARIARGASPAAAVRDERVRQPGSSDWRSDVIVYQ